MADGGEAYEGSLIDIFNPVPITRYLKKDLELLETSFAIPHRLKIKWF